MYAPGRHLSFVGVHLYVYISPCPRFRVYHKKRKKSKFFNFLQNYFSYCHNNFLNFEKKYKKKC